MPLSFTDLCFEIVKDGKWHSLAEFMRGANDWIPPERASQIAAFSDEPLDEAIRKGRRRILFRALNNLKDTGRVLVRGEGFAREYAINPDYKPKSKEHPDNEEVKDKDSQEIQALITKLEESEKDETNSPKEAMDYIEVGLNIIKPLLEKNDLKDLEFHIRSIYRIIKQYGE